MRVVAVTVIAFTLFLGAVWLGGPRARAALTPVPLDVAILDTAVGNDIGMGAHATRGAARLLAILRVASSEAPGIRFTLGAASPSTISRRERARPDSDHVGSGGGGGGLDPAEDRASTEGEGVRSAAGGGSGGVGGSR